MLVNFTILLRSKHDTHLSKSSPFILGLNASTIAAVNFSVERPRFMTMRMVRGYDGSKRAFSIAWGPCFFTAAIAIGSTYVPTAYTLNNVDKM